MIQNNGAIHNPRVDDVEVVKYRAASGALVFTTGTNHWVAGSRGTSEPGRARHAHPAGDDERARRHGRLPRRRPATSSSTTPAGRRPDAPTGVAANALGTDSVRITWNPVAGAQGYNVYRTLVPRDGGEPLGARRTRCSPGTTFTDIGLSSSTAYYYVVTSRGRIQSVASGESQATTAAAAGEVTRINAAGPAYTSSTGQLFRADTFFTGGSTY